MTTAVEEPKGLRLGAVANSRAASEVTRAIFYITGLGTMTGFIWGYIQTFYRARGFPLNTFLFNPQAHFSDLLLFFPLLDQNLPYANRAVYPPLNFVLMEPFAWVGRTPSTVLWVAIGGGGLVLFAFLELNFLGIIDRIAISLGIVCLSYPFLFGFDRGNIEIFVTLALAGGVYLMQTRKFAASGALFGIAGALKIYPIVMVALLLVRHKWVAGIIAVVTAGVLTAAASAAYGFTLPEMADVLRSNSSAYNETYVLNDAGLAWGSSIYGAIKVSFGPGPIQGPADLEQVRAIFGVYSVIIPLGFLAAAAACWLLPLKLWEQVTLLTVALVALPAASADYRLLHFLVPIMLFVRMGCESRLRWWYVILFSLLMIPKPYAWLRLDGTSLSVVANPVVMCALAAMIVATGIARVVRSRQAAGKATGTVVTQ